MNMHFWPQTNINISSSVINKYRLWPLLLKASLNAKKWILFLKYQRGSHLQLLQSLKENLINCYQSHISNLVCLVTSYFGCSAFCVQSWNRLSNWQCQICQIWLKIQQLSNLALKTFIFALREKYLPPYKKTKDKKKRQSKWAGPFFSNAGLPFQHPDKSLFF